MRLALDQMQARVGLYQLASRVFATEIDVHLYRDLVAMSEPTPPHAAGLVLIDETLKHYDEIHAIEELAVEYCRLFIGPQPACPPYAGIHLGQGVVTAQSALAVTSIAVRSGLAVELPPDAPIEANDHVAVVLALLAELSLRAGRTGLQLELLQELTQNHVMNWLPQYLAGLEEEARLDPYRSIARLLRGALVSPSPL